jgi:hypothetical protein
MFLTTLCGCVHKVVSDFELVHGQSNHEREKAPVNAHQTVPTAAIINSEKDNMYNETLLHAALRVLQPAKHTIVLYDPCTASKAIQRILQARIRVCRRRR